MSRDSSAGEPAAVCAPAGPLSAAAWALLYLVLSAKSRELPALSFPGGAAASGRSDQLVYRGLGGVLSFISPDLSSSEGNPGTHRTAQPSYGDAASLHDFAGGVPAADDGRSGLL